MPKLLDGMNIRWPGVGQLPGELGCHTLRLRTALVGVMGVTRLVTHPSVDSIASRTVSNRSARSFTTWPWSEENRWSAHRAAAEPPTSTASGTTSWSLAADRSTRSNSGRWSPGVSELPWLPSGTGAARPALALIVPLGEEG